MIYVLDRLAQRWHIDPDRLAELEPETILRGLAFVEMESQAARVKDG